MLRTRTIKALLGNKEVRLSDKDRKFLSDLSKLNIITSESATKHCYENARQDTVDRRLKRLEEVGLLSSREVVTPNGEKWSAYEFKTQKVASAFNGHKSAIGSKRTAFHECLVSKMYYQLGEPADYRIESRFTDSDKKAFSGGNAIRPDALYTDSTGSEVVVEADSGQYTKSQIAHKMHAWRGYRQNWVQPSKAFQTINETSDITVTRF